MQARAAAGATDIEWHHWRYFTATRLLEMGMSHFDVSVQLGHEDGGALVMATYGHPSKDNARDRLLAAFTFNEAEIGNTAGSNAAAKPHGKA